MKTRFGPFEIDTAAFELRQDGRPVRIEPRVLELLIYLVQNPDRVVTKSELVDRIWQGRAISDAAITSAIKAARRALSPHGAAFIVTVHGRGVRFTEPSRPEPEPPADAAPPEAPRPPSVIVLPFRNVSSDPEQQHLADGITVDVIGSLARHRWLRVVGAGAAFSVEAAGRDLRRIGLDFGVRYVMEGAVRRAGDVVRVSVELLSAEDGRLVWSERYEREMIDVFTLQDDIARAIAAAIEPMLLAAEATRAPAAPTRRLDVWDHYHRGVSDLYSFDPDRLATARAHLETAVALDPDFASAHARLAYAHVQLYYFPPFEARADTLARAEAAARRALALDDRDALGFLALGCAMLLQGRLHDAVGCFDAAMVRHPGHAQPHIAKGETLCFLGRNAEAVQEFDQARRFSPQDPLIWSALANRGLALLRLGEREAALESVIEAARHPRANWWAHAMRLSVHGHLGQEAATRAVRAELAALEPGFDLALAAEDYAFLGENDYASFYLEGLRRAGVPAPAASSA